MTIPLENVFWDDVLQPRGEISERCTFSLLPGNGPTGDLTIFESTFEDGDLLQKVRVLIEFDTIGQDFILSHPIWSRAPKPLMLQFMYAAFWRLKTIDAGFGEPHLKELYINDAASGSTAHLLISTEVYFETGSPVVLLANYANVHLVDQLDACIKEGGLQTPLSDYMGKIQWLRGVWLAASPPIDKQFDQQSSSINSAAVSLFIDETGDLGFRKPEHFYAIFGVAVSDNRLEALRSKLRATLTKYWPGPTQPKEMHFTKVKEPKRERLIGEIAETFNEFVECCNCFVTPNFAFLFHLIRAEIEYFRDEERPSRTNIADLLASPDGHVGNRLLMLATEDLISTSIIENLLTVANVTIIHDRKRSAWMNEAVTDGYGAAIESVASFVQNSQSTLSPPSTSFSIVDSESEPCIWLCDWLGWELGAWLRDERPFSPHFLDVIQKVRFFTFSEDGERVQFDYPGGKELRRYPDRPREIVRLTGHGPRRRNATE
jgi:hypothetical protein